MSLRLRATFIALLCVCFAFTLFPVALAAQQPADPVASEPASGDRAEPDEDESDAADKEPVSEAGSGPRTLCAYRFERQLGAPPAKRAPKLSAVDNNGCPNAKDRLSVNLGHHLVVRVSKLDTVLEEEEKSHGDLRLFLDGVELTDLNPEAVQQVEGIEGTSDVRFKLERNADNRGAWRTLLGPFKLSPRNVTVGVGLAGEEEIAGSPGVTLSLNVVRKGWFFGYLVLLAVVFVAFFFAPMPSGGKLTDSLRDRQAEPSSDGKKPFSLARCQMAWWFFLVIAAYVFLWMVLGDLDTITGSILTLMGIGSGTALGAAMIDSSKKTEKEQAEAELSEAHATAQAATSTPADQVRLTMTERKVANLQGVVKTRHTSVLADLLSDSNGYSFHRFQIAVWTVILGIIFVVAVAQQLAMPQFSETLLGLMGISSGTYLGFKFPERHA